MASLYFLAAVHRGAGRHDPLRGPCAVRFAPRGLRIVPAIRRRSDMRTLALVCLWLITGVVGAALFEWLTADRSAWTAESELGAFRDHVQAEMGKRQLIPVSPTAYVVSMVPPQMLPGERNQLTALEQRHETFRFRRELARWIFTRGLCVGLAFAAISALAKR
ncbi:MAG: hypothetical protein KF715_08135 [Candidatus Didemnitutus sp.]|nr:hypothetical protein [Candidatus Didemnitutus sp.]